ncbi:GIY-YIG nuclease family protein [Candidatus Berkelbacteria bacterium]|nr:GIY-YIG nuclease family protein [Candidatus Berkelbacteria bacterium]
MKGFVYILRCKNDRYYIGSSVNIRRRKIEHDRGHVAATRHLRPLELVFYQEYPSTLEAGRIERWLKQLKDRTILDQIVADRHIIRQFNSKYITTGDGDLGP